MKVASAASLKTELSRWENGHVTPEYYQEILRDFYNMPPGELGISNQQRASVSALENGDSAELISDPEWLRTLDRLDQEAGWEPGRARHQVAAQLAQLDAPDVQDRANLRGRIGQNRIAEALGGYYASCGHEAAGYGRYSARVGRGNPISTSVLTHPGWLDLDCPLCRDSDRLTLTTPPRSSDVPLGTEITTVAARRLAEALAVGGRIVDRPLYRLFDADIRRGQIAGSVSVTPFVRYALTMDLLEGELLDTLSAGQPALPGSLPLRDRYLPDVASVLGTGGRLCAGGALALCAIARPASRHRGPADYALLVQQRSSQVVNATRRLAVIPKGFHQPMTDYRADAQIGATLRRELEEELFGREDADSTRTTGRHAADPMHPSRLTEPMRWLASEPGRLRLECTGFGLNLVSGNFEFACLVVIESEDFWSQYGGDVAANWEASTLRLCSSLDGDSVTELARDVGWSNEGLFAFLQGLRRLSQLGGNRVNLPAIDWEIG